MRVTPSVLITPTKLTSSTVSTLFTPAAYDPGTTYAFGELVLVAADYRIYESLEAGNVGNTPNIAPLWWRACGYVETAYDAGTNYPVGASASYDSRVYRKLTAGAGHTLPVPPEKENENWKYAQATNQMAMFDLTKNTQTVWPSPLTVVVTPGQRIDTLGLAGMAGNTVKISATSVLGGGVVYPEVEVDLVYRDILDSYEYCYAPFQLRPNHVVFDIPPYSDIIITVTIEASAGNGNVKCGAFVVGQSIYLGEVTEGATNQGKNFSSTDRDEWGDADLVARRTIPVINAKLQLPYQYVNRALYARVLLNAVVALWTGLDDADNYWFSMLQAVGFYTEFEIDTSHAESAIVSLIVEEI